MGFRRVVVTGLGAVTPLGNTMGEYWDNLLAGANGIGPITRFDASAEVRHVGEQDRVANEFELPTDDYTLLNAAVAVRPFYQKNVTVFAEARNLTNEEAREHVSFLKDIAPLPGRNLRVGVAYRF